MKLWRGIFFFPSLLEEVVDVSLISIWRNKFETYFETSEDPQFDDDDEEEEYPANNSNNKLKTRRTNEEELVDDDDDDDDIPITIEVVFELQESKGEIKSKSSCCSFKTASSW